MLAAVVVLLGSADSAAAAVLLVPAVLVPVVPVPVPHEPQLPALAPPVLVQLPPALRVLVLAQAAPRPAATPVVFAIAPGGGRIRGTRAPSGPPVVLSRNGKEFTANGETNVRAGTEYKVTTERPTVNINVKELDTGSWVMFELPGFTTAASGTEQSSLDALRNASATSYYKGNGSLWVKVVSTGDVLGSGPGRGPGPGDSLQVSR